MPISRQVDPDAPSALATPVLSEQMAVAPPMVSQAASTRTKLLSFIICSAVEVQVMAPSCGSQDQASTCLAH